MPGPAVHANGSSESSTSHPSAGSPSQSSKPSLHTKPHAVPSQTAVAFGGVAQVSHDAPHATTLSSGSHVSPQAWKPTSHATPHAPSTQVAAPFAGELHSVAQAPQWRGSLEVSTHVPSHRVGVAPSQPLAQAAVPSDAAAQSGAGSAQATGRAGSE